MTRHQRLMLHVIAHRTASRAYIDARRLGHDVTEALLQANEAKEYVKKLHTDED